MSMHLRRLKSLVVKTKIEQIMSSYDNSTEEKIANELIDISRELRSCSYFLISYDFKNNNSKVKSGVLEKFPGVFTDSLHDKSFPNSTLIWRGSSRATTQEAFDNFQNEVKMIINSGDLDTELSKTIVVEILDHRAFVDER